MPTFSKIKNIEAFEVLDSAGSAALRIKITLENSLSDSLTYSKDFYESPFALTDLIDEDNKRFNGQGLLLCISKITDLAKPSLIGKKINDQEAIDKVLISLTGTDKTAFPVSAIFTISALCAKLAARQSGQELYEYLRKTFSIKEEKKSKLPIPIFNVFNGGDTGDTNLDFQEFLLIPKKNKISEIIRSSSEVFKELALVLEESGYDTDTGSEGGYAPDLDSSIEVIELMMSAVIRAGYKLNHDFSLGIDIGASILYDEDSKKYVFSLDNTNFQTADLLSLYSEWLSRYPIIYLEDPFGVDDFESWKNLGIELGKKLILAADDFCSSNIERLRLASGEGIANATIVKPSQIGTLTEFFAYAKLAQERSYGLIISGRNRESVDTVIVDMAVAVEADYLKAGSLSRGERVEKYNRLLEIERHMQK